MTKNERARCPHCGKYLQQTEKEEEIDELVDYFLSAGYGAEVYNESHELEDIFTYVCNGCKIGRVVRDCEYKPNKSFRYMLECPIVIEYLKNYYKNHKID